MLWIAINSLGAMTVAYLFGRKFKGIVGHILDLLVFLAGALSALPCLILLNRPDVAWFIGAWVLAWQGAYHIGNISAPKVRLGILVTWMVVLCLVLIRLSNGVLHDPSLAPSGY